MRGISAVIVGIALAGCGGSPTDPSSLSLVDVRVGDLMTAKLGLPVPAPPGVTGTLSGSFAASIWDGSRWVSLGSPHPMTLGLQLLVYTNAPTSVHGEQRAPAGSYDRARLILQGVTANIAAGSRVGGITLSSDATIQIGGSDRYVELFYPVRFSLGDDSSVIRVITFGLNSQAWLMSSAVQSGQVEDEALQAHISATTSVEAR